ETAASFEQRDGRIVYEADAVPQHVAVRRLDEERALTDRELGSHADAEESGLEPLEAVAMRTAERVERGPALPARRDVLTHLIAHRTTRRRRRRLLELNAAGRADRSHHTHSARSPGECECLRPVSLEHSGKAGIERSRRRDARRDIDRTSQEVRAAA